MDCIYGPLKIVNINLVKSRKKVLAFQMNEKWVDIGEKQEYTKVKNKIADFLND